MHNLSPHYKALVVGASGAIGAAFVNALRHDTNCSRVEVLSRSTHPMLDLTDEASIERALINIKALSPFDLIIDATGALTIDKEGPEKSLQAIQAHHLSKSLWVNCIGPTVLLKNLVPHLSNNRCVYAKLSARVGSISDNKLGGWYSYRASKAAFNMVLHTAGIEHKRKNPNSIFVALQPGTVMSKLSTPFVNQSNAMKPEDSVEQMLAAIDLLEPISGAHFIDFKGNKIAW